MDAGTHDNEPFLLRFLKVCLEEERNDPSSPDGLSDNELYSVFAFVVIAVAFLELTLGPFSLLK